MSDDNLLLTVTHSLTGQTMYRNYLQGVRAEISTSGWPKGIYIVRGEVGETNVVRKINVR